MILLPLLGVTNLLAKGYPLTHILRSHEVWYTVDLSRLPICGYILQLMWILPWRPGAKGGCQQGSSTLKNDRPE